MWVCVYRRQHNTLWYLAVCLCVSYSIMVDKHRGNHVYEVKMAIPDPWYLTNGLITITFWPSKSFTDISKLSIAFRFGAFDKFVAQLTDSELSEKLCLFPDVRATLFFRVCDSSTGTSCECFIAISVERKHHEREIQPKPYYKSAFIIILTTNENTQRITKCFSYLHWLCRWEDDTVSQWIALPKPFSSMTVFEWIQ